MSLTYEVVKMDSGQYGFSIYRDSMLFISQDHNPNKEGFESMTEADCHTIAQAMIDQLNQAEAHFVYVPPLDSVKNEKLAELEQTYNASFNVFTSGALGVARTYPFNSEARDKLKELQDRLRTDPNKDAFYFLTLEDRVLVLHTRVQILQVFNDAEMKEVEIHNQYRSLVNQVEDIAASSTLTDAEKVEQITAVAWK